MNKTEIRITLTTGTTNCWEVNEGEQFEYSYDDKVFVLKKNGELVGLYNLNNVISVIMAKVVEQYGDAR